MIVPASFARRFQAIDTRDLGEFLLLAATARLAGVYNATGPVPPVTMVDLVEGGCAAAPAPSSRCVVVDDAFLAAEGVESELPLWPGDDPQWAAWAETDVSRALAAGLRFRPVEDTVARDARAHRPRAGARAHAGAGAGAARGVARPLGEERLLEQERVEADDDRRDDEGRAASSSAGSRARP